MKVKPSLQALKLSPLFGQTLIGSRPYLTLSGFTLLLKLLKFLARLMPLPSLKLRLLNSKLAGNAHFELALADVPADLDFTNSQLLSFHTEYGTFLVSFVFLWLVFLSLFHSSQMHRMLFWRALDLS